MSESRLINGVSIPILQYQRVSPKTLFKMETYKGLSEDEAWSKALTLGWGWDMCYGKFYRVIGY